MRSGAQPGISQRQLSLQVGQNQAWRRERTSSASARLTLFRLIISFLLNTFIANNFLLCFSLTRYTLPTSPLPKSRIFWNDDGPTSRLRTRIDEDE